MVLIDVQEQAADSRETHSTAPRTHDVAQADDLDGVCLRVDLLSRRSFLGASFNGDDVGIEDDDDDGDDDDVRGGGGDDDVCGGGGDDDVCGGGNCFDDVSF